jgi:hypothetical protein
MAQDNVQLHALVDMVISGPSGLMKGSWVNIILQRTTLLHGVI